MSKLRLTLVLALSLAASPAFAALSGFYDSAERIQTILASSAVADALHQQPIGAISNTGTRKDGASEWTVRTQECDLIVYLVATPPAGPGMTTYTVETAGTCE